MPNFREITPRGYEDAVKNHLRPGETLVATDAPNNPIGKGRYDVTSDKSFRTVKNAGWTFLAES